MERYSLIDTKFPREFLLLQGQGCRWRGCRFCDYHLDVSPNPYEVNRPVPVPRNFRPFLTTEEGDVLFRVVLDAEVTEWLTRNIFPLLKDNKKAEVLVENTDLGVG